MTEFLETTVDKFIFRVATDRKYSHGGVWAKAQEDYVRIGLSDFLQQRSGDVAFADVKPVGTVVSFGEEVAKVETIKVTIQLNSPLSGTVIEINPVMEDAPEAINQDPYAEGWLALIEPSGWEADSARLLDAQSYFEQMKVEAEEEAKKL
ncbi:MAG: glycine cleavage system protein H [Anaerolineales bacterium]